MMFLVDNLRITQLMKLTSAVMVSIVSAESSRRWIDVAWYGPGQCKLSEHTNVTLVSEKRDRISPPSNRYASLRSNRRVSIIQVLQTTWASRASLVKAFHNQIPSCLLMFCNSSIFPHLGSDFCWTYVYFMHYSEDSSAKKLLVIAIWILDTIHASFMCHVLYHYLIINYGVPTSLGYTVWTLSASPVPSACMICAVQLFFAHAIHSLCRPQVRWFVTTPIVLLVLVHFGFDMATVVTTLVDMETSELQRNRFYSVTPAVAITALAEVLITVSLCVLLYDSGSGFASSGTKRLLNTLIVYAVNRCLLNLLVTIAELVEAIELQNAWSTGLSLIIGSLYANSFLASLNCRKRLRRQDSTNKSLADERISAIHFANPPRLSRDGARSKDEIRRIDVHEFLIIDIGADASLDKATTLQRDETV
ncbi:hypothetical protein EDD17DRAFT_1075403 [Pisolithus thermaeus]|nr:hypothetical protein EDD17DRAFT_1075403 [Pisolithus thermaeus]